MLREIKATLRPDSGTVTQHDRKHSDIATRPTKGPTARESSALVSNTYFYISILTVYAKHQQMQLNMCAAFFQKSVPADTLAFICNIDNNKSYLYSAFAK